MLKVGQKVQVRNDLITSGVYGRISFAKSMEEYRGEIFKIDEIVISIEGAPCLVVDGWYFSEPMLTILEQPKPKNSVASVNLEDLQIFFNDNKRTTVIKSWYTDYVKKVTCSEEDNYNRRIGFLEAYFQFESGLTKDEAHKFLDSLEEL